jgi:hypothetical protein
MIDKEVVCPTLGTSSRSGVGHPVLHFLLSAGNAEWELEGKALYFFF